MIGRIIKTTSVILIAILMNGYSKTDSDLVEKASGIGENKSYFAISSGYQSHKGWLYGGKYFDKNYFGIGLTGVAFSVSNRGGGYLVHRPGICFQRTFFMKDSPFISMNTSIPFYHGQKENIPSSLKSMVKSTGINVPTFMFSVGYEFAFQKYLIGVEFSENKIYGNFKKRFQDLSLGISISQPFRNE